MAVKYVWPNFTQIKYGSNNRGLKKCLNQIMLKYYPIFFLINSNTSPISKPSVSVKSNTCQIGKHTFPLKSNINQISRLDIFFKSKANNNFFHENLVK